MDTKEKLSNLMSVTQRLCGIMERENKAIAAKRPQLVRGSLEEKQKLSKAYALLTQSLLQDTDALGELSETVRERIAENMRTLEGLSKINAKGLKVAAEANQRVMNAVADATRKVSQQDHTYGRQGTMMAQDTRNAFHAKPVSLNETL